jgi:hypothetical protein
MLSVLGSRIILNLRGMILREPDEFVTQESMKLMATGRSNKSWNRNPQGSGLPRPVQSTVVTFVESPPVHGNKKDYSDW